MKIGNLLWAETHPIDYGFSPGRQLRITLLPRGRDEAGRVRSVFDVVIKLSRPYAD